MFDAFSVSATDTAEKKTSLFKQSMKRLFRNKGAVAGLIILILFILLAVFANSITPYEYSKMDVKNKNLLPCAEHWFGTDDLGRDIFTRVAYGGRYSLQIGIFGTGLGVIIGSAIGSLCGYYGGLVDDIVMRGIDIIQAVPNMLFAVVVAAALGTGVYELILAMAISSVPHFVRIIRGSILSIRKMEYLDAAVVDNASTFKIITSHLIPNSLAPLIVQATMSTAHVILTASSLSFIGLGVPPPAPEWGAMLAGARGFLRNYPHMLTFPGLAIMMTVLSLNLLGDGLRDALDPKLKR